MKPIIVKELNVILFDTLYTINGEMVDSVLTDADFEKALAAIPALK